MKTRLLLTVVEPAPLEAATLHMIQCRAGELLSRTARATS
jgi:hypothetical protein